MEDNCLGVGDKRLLSGVFLFGIVFAFASFALAGVVITRFGFTTAAFNFNEDVSVAYNITVNYTVPSLANAQANNITQVNITLPSVFVLLANSTNSSWGSGSTSAFSIQGRVLSWTNATAGVINGSVIGVNQTFGFNATVLTPGNYNLTVTATNWSNVYTTNVAVRINDTLVPDVSAANVTLAHRANVTGVIILNVSVVDNGPVDSVLFNITNSSGSVVSVTATNPTSIYWNATLTTSSYADGVYNVTILANDTFGSVNHTTYIGGNLNNSAIIEIIIDNTAPTATALCTPNPVTSGQTITCSCSGTDATSGVLSESADTTPSTTETGPHTFSCSVTDYAGNVGLADFEYHVDATGGGGGGGGGSGSGLSPTITWAITVDQSSVDIGTSSGQITQSLGARERVKVTLNGEAHHVGVVSLSATSAVVEVASMPQRATLNVGQSERFELDGDGYYDMQVTLQSLQGSKATIVTRAIHESLERADGETTSMTGEETVTDQVDSSLEKRSLVWIVAMIVVVGVAFVFFVVWRKKN